MVEQLRRKIEHLALTNVQITTDDILHAMANSELFGTPFDLIVCSSVCAFLDDYPATVGTLARMLRPGGLFVQWDWELDPNAKEPFGLTRRQIKETLASSGLEAIQVETAFEVPMGDETMRPLMGAGQSPEGERG